jgi:hypothetical protein
MYSAFLYLFIDLLLLSPDQSTTTTAQTTRLPSCRPDMRFLFIYLFRFNDFDIFNLFFASFVVAGHYLFIESSSPRVLNDTARLFSPVYGQPEASAVADEGVCFSFWFHMYGSTTGKCVASSRSSSRFLPFHFRSLSSPFQVGLSSLVFF